MMLLFFIDDTLGKKNSEKIFNKEVTPQIVIDGMIHFVATGVERKQYIDPIDGTLKNHHPTKIELSFIKIWKHIGADLTNSGLSKVLLNGYVMRLVESAKRYLPENINIEDKIMTLEEYEEYRVYNSGMMFTIDLMEYTTNTYIEDLINEEYISEELQGMRESMALIGSMTNDLFSFPKEVYGGETKTLNLIVVLMHENGYSFEEAVVKAIDKINEYIHRYLMFRSRLIDKMKTINNEEIYNRLAKYISILDDIGVATYRWQLEGTYRYRHFYHIFKQMRFNEGFDIGNIVPVGYEDHYVA